MVRKSIGVPGNFTCRLLVSAALSCTLIPVANAQAPSAPVSSAPAAKVKSGAQKPTETSGKPLFTVPEDGLGDTKWLSGATRLVREITLKRSSEDLVICIAGCVDKQDRVVFAQPVEVAPPKPAGTTSDAGDKPSAGKTSAATEADQAIEPAPKSAATAPDESVSKPEFKPSMAEPKPAEENAPPASKDDAAPKPEAGDGAAAVEK